MRRCKKLYYGNTVAHPELGTAAAPPDLQPTSISTSCHLMWMRDKPAAPPFPFPPLFLLAPRALFRRRQGFLWTMLSQGSRAGTGPHAKTIIARNSAPLGASGGLEQQLVHTLFSRWDSSRWDPRQAAQQLRKLNTRYFIPPENEWALKGYGKPEHVSQRAEHGISACPKRWSLSRLYKQEWAEEAIPAQLPQGDVTELWGFAPWGGSTEGWWDHTAEPQHIPCDGGDTKPQGTTCCHPHADSWQGSHRSQSAVDTVLCHKQLWGPLVPAVLLPAAENTLRRLPTPPAPTDTQCSKEAA